MTQFLSSYNQKPRNINIDTINYDTIIIINAENYATIELQFIS